VLISGTATLALAVPGGISAAQVISPQPDLKALVAQAKQLESQINSLSEQYDGLRIQLTRAKANAKIAQQAASRGQASTIAEMDQSSGVMVSTLSRQVTQALRDKQTAEQQIAAVNAVETQMGAKKKLILAKIDTVNSAAMKQAMAVFEQTGHYPPISLPTEHTVSIQALQAALTREGDPYVWGAAGPSEFDCSGLVVWAYAQEGITLPHYTGWLWNSGVHVARSDLEPGDLVFFGADISHVGIYVGNGLMLDAPNSGAVVRIEPLFGDYVGAVRIG
jgi:cell wall-associated NlpC family hydrolase